MLDVGSLDFTYSVLATSALYHTESEAVALLVSGYTWPDISRCVRWMSAFALALRERSPLQPKSFHGVQPDDAHHLQVRVFLKVFPLKVCNFFFTTNWHQR